MTRQKQVHLFKGISRNVVVLGIVSLLTDCSSQMVFPLLPLFMTSVLGASAFAVGLVEGAAEAAASLLKVVSGYWSDRIERRKPFVLFGYSLSAIMKPLFSAAGAWGTVLSIRVFERIGKGLRNAPRDAIVAESCDKGRRGTAYGFHRAMDGAGSILGAVAAFMLLPSWGYRKIFLFALVPGVIAAVVVLLVRETKRAVPVDVKSSGERPRFSELPRELRRFIAAATLFAFGHFGYAFLLLKAQHTGLADRSAVLLYVLFYVVYTAVSIPSGMLSDRIGRKPVLAAGYALFAAMSAWLLLTSGAAGVTGAFILYGICYGLIDGVQRALVADLAPARLKATALGAFHTATGMVALPGGFIAGLLWDRMGPGATFTFGLLLSAAALLALSTVKGGDRWRVSTETS